MKKSGICPKCQSEELAPAKAVDKINYAVDVDAQIATYSDPNALFFKGEKTAIISAIVCLSCGYLEYYAESPRDLA